MKSANKSVGFLSSTALHIIAMALMLCDHLWATIVPGNMWMTYIGRAAFPIFAFLISEGYVHTSNYKKYALRLLAFGLISEIPFDLMYGSTVFYPFHQNVMFTLLLGLLSIRALDRVRGERTAKRVILALLTLLFSCALAFLGMTDYGAMGVLTVVAFYLFKDIPLAWLGQAVSMILLNIVYFQGMYIPINVLGFSLELQTQGFALLALIPIWLYNGQKGSGGRSFKYLSYAFYPVHMLALYTIFQLY